MTAVNERTRNRVPTTTLPQAKRLAMASMRRVPESFPGVAVNQSIGITSSASLCNAHAVKAAWRSSELQGFAWRDI